MNNNHPQNMHFPNQQLMAPMNGNNHINNSPQSPSPIHQFPPEQIVVVHQQQSEICSSNFQNAEFLVTKTNQQVKTNFYGNEANWIFHILETTQLDAIYNYSSRIEPILIILVLN
jgi:hypothetical protein